MPVILKPVPHRTSHHNRGDNQGEIVIEDALFPVGRNEHCFSAYDPETRAVLSKRHARLFSEKGQVYIADLGSKNGTTLNNLPVEFKPKRLKSGDQIAFAKRFTFDVEINLQEEQDQKEKDQKHESSQLQLTLIPQSEELGAQRVTITQFPLLVGSSDERVIPRETCAEKARKYLSRRHAHFFLKKDELYLEDLDSTNGTYVNGERLEEQARTIQSGDRIKFGSPYCVFEAEVQNQNLVVQNIAESSDNPKESMAADNRFQTAFVAAADSFLNIFCIDDHEDHLPIAQNQEAIAVNPPENPASEAPPEEGKKKRSKPGLFYRPRRFLIELKSAFAEQDGQDSMGEKKRSNVKWLIAGLLPLACVFGLILFYVMDAEQREIKTLFAQQRYQLATEAANHYLPDNPDDEEINKLAIEALIKYIVPKWLASIETQNHQQAFADLAAARSISYSIQDSIQGSLQDSLQEHASILELLEWITQLDKYIEERGGAVAPIVIYSNENRVNELLRWWEGDEKPHRSSARLISSFVPEFEEIELLTYSYIRTLENDQSVYLAAIDKLKREIDTQLDENQAKALVPVLDDYNNQYPRLGGILQLKNDLVRYLPIESAIKANDLYRAANEINATRFETPPFIEKIKQLQASKLPSAENIGQFQVASDAWRSGDFDRALTILEKLSLENMSLQPGANAAQLQLKHKQDLLNEYHALQNTQDSPDYIERLISFYIRLAPEEDVYLIEQVGDEFASSSSTVLEEAELSWQSAEQRWNRYLNQGGIGGSLRLEEKVSDKFKQQVNLLNTAYEYVNRAKYLYELLKKTYSAERESLQRDIEAEIEMQRRSLDQLNIVLGKNLLEKKLGLFAEVQFNSPLPKSPLQ